ncbi:MAG TPA: hypothetical protein DCM54_11575 [Gammaproteobacteria bacterium]|nr:hypothetical protein [Gammaproteobacteria bacterium]|tara:strand:+ start:1287 stop:1706 length:420 start_codon:yes stop_codon:yes gene_type:complete
MGRRNGGQAFSSTAVDFASFLWGTVGNGFWEDRQDWTSNQWREQLGDILVGFYAAYCGGEPVGCFELRRDDNSIRIEGFGLLPEYRGNGLGQSLLTAALEKSFAMGGKRIWTQYPVTTHPAAEPLFYSIGFKSNSSLSP